MGIINRIANFLCDKYYKYTLHTSVYMLEAWEVRIFNSLLIAFLAMASYTTYLFLPGHLVMLRHYLDYFFGSGDSGMATATVPTLSTPDAPPTS